MTNIDIAKGMVFQKLNIRDDTFDDRLISQKKIYILQALGTDLGYEYNWYLRGPYSPSLTSYIYDNINLLSIFDFSEYSLSNTAEKHLNLVNSLEKLNSDRNISVSSWYELLASLLTQEMSILPSYEVFAKELGITRTSACKIYNRLNNSYGHWNNDGFVIDCKARAVQQLQESIQYAIKQGITCNEMIKLIADNT